jgi:hypothetical protein
MRLGHTDPPDRREALARRYLQWDEPELPGLAPGTRRRWSAEPAWLPLGTRPLVRHRALDRPHWFHSTNLGSPRGYVVERLVGVIYDDPTPSSRRLAIADDGTVAVTDTPQEPPVDHVLLGHVEQLPYAMMSPLEWRSAHATGQHVLLSHPLDPLRAESDLVARVGWVDSLPVAPDGPPERPAVLGLHPLVRHLDARSGRHRYEAPGGEEGVRLGSLWHAAGPAFVALRRDAGGRLSSELHAEPPARAGAPGEAARWVAAPLRWAGPRWGTRATAARAVRIVRGRGRAPTDGEARLGFLRRAAAPGWSPLFSSIHPAVGDQYVTRSALEAADMGYRVTGILGHVCDHGAQVPPPAPDIPWASRFGRGRRYVEGPLPGDAASR